jgi:hypothetical protein
MTDNDTPSLEGTGTDEESTISRRGFMGSAATLATAATVAGAAPSADDVTDAEVADQQQRLARLADRDDADRWAYETTNNLASVNWGVLGVEIDTVCDDPGGSIETYHCAGDSVPVASTVTGDPDRDENLGTLVHLSADQAEALAVDLLEQAHAARQNTDE